MTQRIKINDRIWVLDIPEDPDQDNLAYKVRYGTLAEGEAGLLARMLTQFNPLINPDVPQYRAIQYLKDLGTATKMACAAQEARRRQNDCS